MSEFPEFRTGRMIVVALMAGAGFAYAEPPAGVENLAWCQGSRTCLTWSAAAGATVYEVYRGSHGDLPGLLDDSIDSCAVDAFAETATGEVLADVPSPGTLHWYLVRASDGVESGEFGSASAGPRVVNSSGPCSTASGIVINELDYDQPGIDSAEFVELFNPGPSPRPLAGLVVILVNGTSSAEYARVELGQAGESLPAGGYLVVGTASAIAAAPPESLTLEFASSTNNMQNGAPDGVALFDTGQGILLDVLSYEGAITAAQFDGVSGTFNLVEGNPASAADSGTLVGSLARLPNGADTGDALADWGFSAVPSPGRPNVPPK